MEKISKLAIPPQGCTLRDGFNPKSKDIQVLFKLFVDAPREMMFLNFILLTAGGALLSLPLAAQDATLPDSPTQTSPSIFSAPRLVADLYPGTAPLVWRTLPSLNIAAAQEGSPAPRPTQQPSLMGILSRRGVVDAKNERFNIYGQFTYISGWKPSFNAPYTNFNGSINSLLPEAERSFTGTATAYLGLRTWRGGELYFVPELISEKPLSELRGLGGAIQDFELQKGGDVLPTLYRSRLFLKQTIELGGTDVEKDSGPLQLGTTYKSRRLMFVAGNYSILDFFDKNAFDIDPRQGLFSLAFLTYTAYDFASDARGYSWGVVTELDWDNWSARYSRITPPKDPNQLAIDWRLFKYYGDQVEIEHEHKIHDLEGKVRVLGYRNRENIGNFSRAVSAFEADPAKNATTCTGFNYGSLNATAPDLCWSRGSHVKEGIGVFAEQYFAKDIGIFGRAMVSDGKSEVYAYTSTDRSAAVGVLARGKLWKRPFDVTGVGYNAGGISESHQRYLEMGGVDGFVGDGKLNPGVEMAYDVFYNVNVHKALWFSGDYQHILNPGFNVDRGLVDVYSLKIHGEF